jgi:AcrR family transcriptional regulator
MNRPGLRERKKLETLHRIQEEALRLFDEQGYDATTIEQIAEAAGVSPSTFYRYFPVKEDVVVQDEYDPLIVEVFERQPSGAPALEVLRSVLAELFEQVTGDDLERIRRRARMILTVPALRARQLANSIATEDLLARLIAERADRSPKDLEVRHFVAVVVASWTVGIIAWTESDDAALAPILDRCMSHLEAGLPL